MYKKKKISKRGQIYIAAALIIAGLLISTTTIYNYVSTNERKDYIYDLTKEISFEGSRLIDRGIFKDDEDLEEQIKNLTNYYSLIYPESELIFLYGDSSNLKVYHYKLNEKGNTCIQTGACSGVSFFEKTIEEELPDIKENKKIINVKIGENLYSFNLKSGQNFYIVLILKKDGETIISSNEN